MTFYILTLFPQTFEQVFSQSIIGHAVKRKLVKIKIINIRDFGIGLRKNVDDKPYGGGKGMILRVDVIAKALKSIKPRPYSILLSASGENYDQKMAASLSEKKSIALICGHYEGVDTRVEKSVNQTIGIGNFILTGGEIAAMAIVDSATRLIPGVIHPESLKSESFSVNGKFEGVLSINRKGKMANGKFLLEYPQYTRPEVFGKMKVPKILLSGNHQEILKWRKQQSILRTSKFRPDLLKQF